MPVHQLALHVHREIFFVGLERPEPGRERLHRRMQREVRAASVLASCVSTRAPKAGLKHWSRTMRTQLSFYRAPAAALLGAVKDVAGTKRTHHA